MILEHPRSNGVLVEETQTLLNRLGWTAAAAYATLAFAIGLADIVFILRHYTRYPFGDHWIWLGRYAERGLWAALLTQFNEHRLFFPGLLYWADLTLFGGKNAFLIFASILINLGCIVVLILPIIRRLEVPLPVRMTFAGFVTITMWWFIQGPNFFYPFSLCLALANLGVLSSLCLFSLFHEREIQGRPARADLLLAGSILCGFVGTFSYGHGILIWPLLLCDAAILRLRARHWIPIAGATLLALALYFRQYITPVSHSNPVAALRSPIKLANYFFIMIGLPWLGGENAQLGWRTNILQYGIIIGGFLAAALLIGIYVFRRERDSFTTFYSSILLLALGSAAITALGRSNFPVAQSLSGRYAPIPLLFWISLSSLVTFYLCRFESPVGLGKFFWCVILAGCSAATLPTQFAMGNYLAGRERAQENAVASIASGVPDQTVVGVELYPAYPLIKLVDTKTMQSMHRGSLFQLPESRMAGTPLQTHFWVSGNCEGSVDEVKSYQGDSKNGVRLSGWLFDTRRGAAAKVLVTDQRGDILGFGTGDFARPDVAATLHNPSMERTGWIAYSPFPADGSRLLRVFGEFPDSSVCEVVSPKTLVPQ
jgi:hypothetical protein